MCVSSPTGDSTYILFATTKRAKACLFLIQWEMQPEERGKPNFEMSCPDDM
jgi:hypothetical protein